MEDGSVDAEDVLTAQTVDRGLTQFPYHFTEERWLVSFPAIWNLDRCIPYLLSFLLKLHSSQNTVH